MDIMNFLIYIDYIYRYMYVYTIDTIVCIVDLLYETCMRLYSVCLHMPLFVVFLKLGGHTYMCVSLIILEV